MKLDDVLGGSEALIEMERYVDEGARSYSRFAARSEADPRYQPRSDLKDFELPTVYAPRSDVAVFQAGPDIQLLDYYASGDSVLFPVHPQTWASPTTPHLTQLRRLPAGPAIRVAPTASTRTTLSFSPPTGVPVHFIKLHYPFRISRFDRRLRRLNIENSICVAKEVCGLAIPGFACLPDTIGATYGNDRSDWGYLIRELTPRPAVDAERFLIPFFSLFASDLRRPGDPPLLAQMVERLAVEAEAFVLDQIMLPVLEYWVRVVKMTGILLETHAQNLLLEIGQDFRPRRIVYRDFDVWIDFEARKRAGLNIPFVGRGIGSHPSYPRAAFYSCAYDKFIGRSLFDYLLRALERFYQVDARRVRRLVKEAFHSRFPDAELFFPSDTTFYFSDELLPGNDFRFVDTHEQPEWR